MKKTCIGNERPNIKKLKEIRHHHMRHTICQPLSPVIKKCKETPKNSIQETSAEKNEKSRKDNNKMPRKFPEGAKKRRENKEILEPLSSTALSNSPQNANRVNKSHAVTSKTINL